MYLARVFLKAKRFNVRRREYHDAICKRAVSSLQGSAAVVAGTLALLSKYPNLENALSSLVYNQAFFLPVLLLIPSLLRIILQGRLHKGNSNWKLPNGNQG